MKPHVRKNMEQNEEKLAENELLEVGDIGLDDAAADMSVSDTKAVLIGGSEASDMNQWSTSVVVVPSGPPMRCLRRDMVTDLVFEVWVMVSRAMSSTRGARRSKTETRIKWLYSFLVRPTTLQCTSTSHMMPLLPPWRPWATLRRYQKFTS